jgi:dihydropteroate synthase
MDNANGFPGEGKVEIMAIINLSPDSFYEPSHCSGVDSVLRQALKFREEGATYLDIGAESSRPGAKPIPVKCEVERLLPVVSRLNKELPDLRLSVDTYKPEVARAVLGEGAHIINDITGGSSEMLKVIAQNHAGVILMHMQGKPETMQIAPHYDNLIAEITDFLSQRLHEAEEAGVDEDKIWIDPGIGFGKTVDQNIKLIAQLDKLKVLKKPVLLGASRKSFIGKILDQEVADRLEGSLAVAIMGYLKGANILRVHDVGATQSALTMFSALCKNTLSGEV